MVMVDESLRLGCPLRDGVITAGMTEVVASCGCITLAGFNYGEAFFQIQIRCPHCMAQDPELVAQRMAEEFGDAA